MNSTVLKRHVLARILVLLVLLGVIGNFIFAWLVVTPNQGMTDDFNALESIVTRKALVATWQLATEYVMRPVPRLNSTLFVFGVRLLPPESAITRPLLLNENGTWTPATSTTTNVTALQFFAILERNEYFNPDNAAQMMTAPEYGELEFQLQLRSKSGEVHSIDCDKPVKETERANLITCRNLPEVLSRQLSAQLPALAVNENVLVDDLFNAVSLVDQKQDVFMDLPLVRRAHRLRNFTLCVAFIKQARTHILADFVHYHSLLGVDRFVFYDRFGEKDTAEFVLDLAQQMMEDYDVEIEYYPWPGMTVNRDFIKRTNWFYDQFVALQHCHYQGIGRTRWMGHWDLDEYVYVPPVIAATATEQNQMHGLKWSSNSSNRNNNSTRATATEKLHCGHFDLNESMAQFQGWPNLSVWLDSLQSNADWWVLFLVVTQSSMTGDATLDSLASD